MTVQKYGLKFNQISRYAPLMVVESRAQMNKLFYVVSDLLKIECRNAMLHGDMNISRIMTHAHQVEGDKLREQANKNKKARTTNYDYSQQKASGGNRSIPAPSSTTVPSSKNRFEQKIRAPGSKSQGCVSGTKTHPTFPKCCKNHSGECIIGKKKCLGCDQSGHRLRDFPSRQVQEGSNGRAQSTTSSAPANRQTQQGNSSCTSGGQRQNRLYALQAFRDQEISPYVVTGTLRVFELDVYALLDPGDTHSFVTPYIVVKFSVSLETLSEPFSISTPVGDQVIARQLYRNCPVKVSQKVNSPIWQSQKWQTSKSFQAWLVTFLLCLSDCRTRVVRFQFPDETILEYKGTNLAPMGRLISYLKARKMISKGYLYHLVQVKDSSSETPTL